VFYVRLTCCGRAAGFYGPCSWAAADAFREVFLSGPGVGGGGHERSAIVVDSVG
jgi:hypothetical protein